MQLTFTPLSIHSVPNVCVNFTTPAFEALYANCFCGCGTRKDTEIENYLFSTNEDSLGTTRTIPCIEMNYFPFSLILGREQQEFSHPQHKKI